VTRSRWIAALAVLCTLVVPTHLQATTTLPVPPPPTSAPANVVATAGNARVTLTWSAVTGAAGYRVFRGENGVWNPAPVATTSNTTLTSYNLTNGSMYSFTVAAYTKGGNGPVSLAVSAMPLAPPSGVTATFGDTRITLNWTPSAGAASYTIYRKVSGEPAYSEFATGVVAPPFVDTGLTNGTRYYYQLRALAGATQSGLSASVSAVPLPPPPASAPAVTAVPGNAKVTLTWNALPDATSY
jgi:cellulose 1,4-beta-cellobiosidase